MVQLNFFNAHVKDSGDGLIVNGRSLESLISVALGTNKRPLGKYDWVKEEDRLKPFSSDLCNVSVTIDDRSGDVSETIIFSTGESVEEVEFSEYLEGLANEHTEEAETGEAEE